MWWLKRKDFPVSHKALTLNYLLDGVKVLPIKDCLDFEGTLKVNGKELSIEQMVQFREGAVSLGNNWTYRTIKEQIAFEAIKIGIHTSGTTEQLLFSKAALWIQAKEMEFISKISGQNHEDTL